MNIILNNFLMGLGLTEFYTGIANKAISGPMDKEDRHKWINTLYWLIGCCSRHKFNSACYR